MRTVQLWSTLSIYVDLTLDHTLVEAQVDMVVGASWSYRVSWYYSDHSNAVGIWLAGHSTLGLHIDPTRNEDMTMLASPALYIMQHGFQPTTIISELLACGRSISCIQL